MLRALFSARTTKVFLYSSLSQLIFLLCKNSIWKGFWPHPKDLQEVKYGKQGLVPRAGWK